MPNRVCFVCLGNICRSPTAEGVMRHLVAKAGLEDEIEIDSAGTSAAHRGEPADPRARQAAAARGIELSSRARRLTERDLNEFDWVLAMDRENLSRIAALAERAGASARIALLRDFDPEAPASAEVPDPYYGGEAGFEEVLDLCARACRGLLETIRTRPRPAPPGTGRT